MKQKKEKLEGNFKKELKNQSSALIMIVSCISVLMLVTYFSLNFGTAKGTYSAQVFDCSSFDATECAQATGVCVWSGGYCRSVSGSSSSSSYATTTTACTKTNRGAGCYLCGNSQYGEYKYYASEPEADTCDGRRSCTKTGSSCPSTSSSSGNTTTTSRSITCSVSMSCGNTVVASESIVAEATVTVYLNGTKVSSGATEYLRDTKWSSGGSGYSSGGNGSAGRSLYSTATITATSSPNTTINTSFTATLSDGTTCTGSKTINVIPCEGCTTTTKKATTTTACTKTNRGAGCYLCGNSQYGEYRYYSSEPETDTCDDRRSCTKTGTSCPSTTTTKAPSGVTTTTKKATTTTKAPSGSTTTKKATTTTKLPSGVTTKKTTTTTKAPSGSTTTTKLPSGVTTKKTTTTTKAPSGPTTTTKLPSGVTTKKTTTTKKPSSSVVRNCYVCSVNGNKMYVYAVSANSAAINTGGTNCTVVADRYCDAPENPKTGTAAIVFAWIVGLGAMGYSFWYFAKSKALNN